MVDLHLRRRGGTTKSFWRDFVTNLRFVGYEGALSVEMESDYMDIDDGMEKQFDMLRRLVLGPAPGLPGGALVGGGGGCTASAGTSDLATPHKRNGARAMRKLTPSGAPPTPC